MRDTFYVIFNKHGINRFVRTDRFDLKGGEYAQRVDWEVDDALFRKIQIPSVTLHVGQNEATMVRSVEPEVRDDTTPIEAPEEGS